MSSTTPLRDEIDARFGHKAAPRRRTTNRWRAYVVLMVVWFAAIVASLFFAVDTNASKALHAIAYNAIAVAAVWFMLPPAKYEEASK